MALTLFKAVENELLFLLAVLVIFPTDGTLLPDRKYNI